MITKEKYSGSKSTSSDKYPVKNFNSTVNTIISYYTTETSEILLINIRQPNTSTWTIKSITNNYNHTTIATDHKHQDYFYNIILHLEFAQLTRNFHQSHAPLLHPNQKIHNLKSKLHKTLTK